MLAKHSRGLWTEFSEMSCLLSSTWTIFWFYAWHRKKCVFGARQVKYLGHFVLVQAISPMPERVQAVQEFLPSSSKLALQCYLGMVNYYYRRLIPRLADILTLLNAAPAGGNKKKDTSGQSGA